MSQRTKGIIAIDGPAGSGKSTAARNLAARLGYLHLNSGDVYRAVTFAAIGYDIPLEDGGRIGEMASRLKMEFVHVGNNPTRLLLNGMDRTADIRTELVSRAVPIVAQHPEVRRIADDMLRELGANGGIVCDGRDIGSNVFPDAEVKFYLDADLSERARRCGQLEYRVQERDQKDRERAHSPLRQAPGAYRLDTTHLGPELVANILHDKAVPLLPR